MSFRPYVLGVVLSAGESRRMGRPKALLPLGPHGQTFVARIVQTLSDGGVPDIVVVGRPDDGALRSVVEGLSPAARFVANASAEMGQISSILVGLDEAERQRARAVLVMPVDMPLIAPETVAALLAAFTAQQPPIARVTYGGQHGHPVIFDARVFADLRHADMSIGAKAVLRKHAGDVLNVETSDPGVLRDVDFTDDYRAIFGHDPE